VTEDEFKGLKATQEGFPCVALPGVWSWKRRLHGVSFPIPDLDRVEWRERVVGVVFDGDLVQKPPVAWAEHALVKELRRRGTRVFVLRLPLGEKGEKYGLDDFLVGFGGAAAFKALPMLTLNEADAAEQVFYRIGDLADRYLLRASQPHHRIQMGFPSLDTVIRGVAPAEVMTILGRSGVGKPAFMRPGRVWHIMSIGVPPDSATLARAPANTAYAGYALNFDLASSLLPNHGTSR